MSIHSTYELNLFRIAYIVTMEMKKNLRESYFLGAVKMCAICFKETPRNFNLKTLAESQSKFVFIVNIYITITYRYY